MGRKQLTGIETNTISELTSASGVTIDGVLIKDGLVDGKDVSTIPNISVGTSAPGSPATGDLWVDTN